MTDAKELITADMEQRAKDLIEYISVRSAWKQTREKLPATVAAFLQSIYASAYERGQKALIPALLERAREEEREACARIAQNEGWSARAGDRVSSYGEGAYDMADKIASRIRAREPKEPAP